MAINRSTANRLQENNKNKYQNTRHTHEPHSMYPMNFYEVSVATEDTFKILNSLN